MSTSDPLGGVVPAPDLPLPHSSARPPSDLPSLPLGAAGKLRPETSAALPSVEQMTAWANAFFQSNDLVSAAPAAPAAHLPGLTPAASGAEAMPSIADPRRTAAAASAPLTTVIPTGIGANEALAPQRAAQATQPYYFLAPELPTHPSDQRITKAALAAQPLDAGPGLFDVGAPSPAAALHVPYSAAPIGYGSALPRAASPAAASPYSAGAPSYANNGAPSYANGGGPYSNNDAPSHANHGEPPYAYNGAPSYANSGVPSHANSSAPSHANGGGPYANNGAPAHANHGVPPYADNGASSYTHGGAPPHANGGGPYAYNRAGVPTAGPASAAYGDQLPSARRLDADPGLFDLGAAFPNVPFSAVPIGYSSSTPAAAAVPASTSGVAPQYANSALPSGTTSAPINNRREAAPTHGSAGVPAHVPSGLTSSPYGELTTPAVQPAQRGFEVSKVRADFPILHQSVNGRPLVWLDNAATTQKPSVVIERLAHFYRFENSNIHRGAHTLAARSTDAYEQARESVRRFLNAGSTEEIVFVRGATEGINLVAASWGGRFIEAGDEVIVSRIEHHSNIIPWKQLCERTGARLRVAEVDDTGQIDLDQYERLFNSHTRLVAFTHVSNALGTIMPAQTMTQIAHRHGARVMIDGAQSVCHMPVDVQALDADFYVFSGHKVFGPTGIGVVYGKRTLLAAMPPWQGGGNMIADVTFEKTVYQPPPMRFEAGTGNIADAVGLGVALDYLMAVGLDNVARHEHALLEYGTHALSQVPGLHFVGTAKEKAAVLGFVLENKSSEQVGSALAQRGIAVRAGHHCAQPALRRFGHETTVRPSLAMYNDHSDIDALVSTLHELQSTWPSR